MRMDIFKPSSEHGGDLHKKTEMLVCPKVVLSGAGVEIFWHVLPLLDSLTAVNDRKHRTRELGRQVMHHKPQAKFKPEVLWLLGLYLSPLGLFDLHMHF